MGEKPSRPIKVMHIIARMNVGGPAVEITELMRGLAPNVISQRLVTGHCGIDEADFLETQAPDISATRIEGLGRSIRPTDDARALATLVRMIRASRPDIVHTHTTKAGVLGRIAAKASGVGAKVIHTHHGHLLHGYFGPRKTRVLIELERRLSRITDRIITVGDKVRDDLLDAGIGTAKQYTVIRAGIELGPLPDKQNSRRELGIPDGPVIVSIIGRITQIKRPDRFADVVEITRQRGLNVHFLVVGGGELESHLDQRVRAQSLPVSILGWRSDLPRILAATDIVVLTSDSEGVPVSLIQAGLAGLPVVATNVGGVSEVVLHEQTGLVVSPNALQIADALELLIRSPSSRDSLGRLARLRIRAQFEPHMFLWQHGSVYRETSGSRN